MGTNPMLLGLYKLCRYAWADYILLQRQRVRERKTSVGAPREQAQGTICQRGCSEVPDKVPLVHSNTGLPKKPV